MDTLKQIQAITCKAEEADAYGIHNLSACRTCEYKNDHRCPYLPVEVHVPLEGKYVPKFITARSINGSDMIDFEYNPETGLYHWNGDSNYAGYTAEELRKRQC